MPFLSIHPFDQIKPRTAIKTISSSLDTLPKHPISHISWPEFAYQPDVQFSIAYITNAILMKFFVTEDHIRHVNTKPNSPVYEDSCVEFFFSPDNNDDYYNFEFNPMGTCLAAYGNSRHNRKFLADEQITSIRTLPFFQKGYDPALKGKEANGVSGQSQQPIHWELTLMIPLTVFIHHPKLKLEDKTCSGNFYKCGDALPLPHYLSWNPLEAPQPDFHVPGSFGMIYFAK
jgi:hypothetical protein